MKINVNRLCTLAGIDSRENKRSNLKESMQYDEGEDHMSIDEEELEEGMYEEELEEGMYEEELEEDDDMIEIDETMLVQELRRAKKMMLESRKVEKRRSKNLLEAELKTIVETEVEKVMKELNLNSGWVYGNKKPTQSRRGYTHQGSFLKGLGFK